MTGEGRIDADAERAQYALRWLGVPVEQTTRRQADQVDIAQSGPGFVGEIRLLRVG